MNLRPRAPHTISATLMTILITTVGCNANRGQKLILDELSEDGGNLQGIDSPGLFATHFFNQGWGHAHYLL